MRKKYRLHLHQQLPYQPAAVRDHSLLAVETVDALDNLFTKVFPLLTALLIRLPLLLAATLVIDPLTALLFALTLPIAPFLLYLIGQATKKAADERHLVFASRLDRDCSAAAFAILSLCGSWAVAAASSFPRAIMQALTTASNAMARMAAR